MGFLQRARHDAGIVNLPEPTVVREAFFGPGVDQDVECLVEARL